MARGLSRFQRMNQAETLVVLIGEGYGPDSVFVSALEVGGYRVIAYQNGSTFLAASQLRPPDLIILDITISGPQGLGSLENLREKLDCPVLLLSTSDDEFDCILGLESGGDDYVVKPLSERELLARVKALFRRVERQQFIDIDKPAFGKGVRYESLYLDTERRLLFCGLKQAPLTLSEFFILHRMMANPSRIFTREELLHPPTGNRRGGSRAVDMHIANLRKKIVDLEPSFVPLRAIRAQGYRFG